MNKKDQKCLFGAEDCVPLTLKQLWDAPGSLVWAFKYQRWLLVGISDKELIFYDSEHHIYRLEEIFTYGLYGCPPVCVKGD